MKLKKYLSFLTHYVGAEKLHKKCLYSDVTRKKIRKIWSPNKNISVCLFSEFPGTHFSYMSWILKPSLCGRPIINATTIMLGCNFLIWKVLKIIRFCANFRKTHVDRGGECCNIAFDYETYIKKLFSTRNWLKSYKNYTCLKDIHYLL